MSNHADHNKSTAAAFLAWYVEMGVNCAVSDAPTDWRQSGDGKTSRQTAVAATGNRVSNQAAASPAPNAAASQPPQRLAAARAPDQAESLARELAKSAQSLDELEALLHKFDGCALSATAKNLCFFRGSATAPLAIIGEAPGRDEDLAGKPFVGRAGQLLDKMLAGIGLGESDVHITNTVYWRPPGNRAPTPLETQICRPFLIRQMELLRPKIVLVLGGVAAKTILDVSDGIMRLRGRWRTWQAGDHEAPVMASLHPAYLLRTPAAKRLAWRDLLEVKAAQEKS